MIISGAAIAFISVITGLLALRFGPFAGIVDFLGPVITGVVGITLLTLLFIGLVLLIGNLRNMYGESAGWFDVIILWVLVVIIAGILFGALVALLTGLLCVGFVYYLHLAQD
jgi:hypothetical protein